MSKSLNGSGTYGEQTKNCKKRGNKYFTRKTVTRKAPAVVGGKGNERY